MIVELIKSETCDKIVIVLMMKKRRKPSDSMRIVFDNWTSWKNAKEILGEFL